MAMNSTERSRLTRARQKARALQDQQLAEQLAKIETHEEAQRAAFTELEELRQLDPLNPMIATLELHARALVRLIAIHNRIASLSKGLRSA
jgi:hypothetical protein